MIGMTLFESAGFSEVLPPAIASAVKEIAVGVRTGPAVNDEHEWVERIVANAAVHFEASTFIVGGWDWRKPDGTLEKRQNADLTPMIGHLQSQCRSILAVWEQSGRRLEDCWFEVGNELDISYWDTNLEAFHALAMACYRTVREVSPRSPFITGSTMNFNKAQFFWQRAGYEVLKELCGFAWPADTL